MDTTVTIQMTKNGLLISRQDLGDMGEIELEAVRKEKTIVIRPKMESEDERSRVRNILRDAGMLYEPDWKEPEPVSKKERARLANKLGESGSLSDDIIADRENNA